MNRIPRSEDEFPPEPDPIEEYGPTACIAVHGIRTSFRHDASACEPNAAATIRPSDAAAVVLTIS